MCGAALECPEPPPLRAQCYRCRAEFSPAEILRSVVLTTPQDQPQRPPSTEPYATAARGVEPELSEEQRRAWKRAGIALIVAGFLSIVAAPFSGRMLAYGVAGGRLGVELTMAGQPVDPWNLPREELIKRVSPPLMFAAAVGYLVLGLTILAGGISAVAGYSRALALAGAVACLIPSCACFFIAMPLGIYAAFQLQHG